MAAQFPSLSAGGGVELCSYLNLRAHDRLLMHVVQTSLVGNGTTQFSILDFKVLIVCLPWINYLVAIVFQLFALLCWTHKVSVLFLLWWNSVERVHGYGHQHFAAFFALVELALNTCMTTGSNAMGLEYEWHCYKRQQQNAARVL